MKLETVDHTLITLDESGTISTLVEVGDIVVSDMLYPLCSNAVETEVTERRPSNSYVKVQPHTYKRRCFYE